MPSKRLAAEDTECRAHKFRTTPGEDDFDDLGSEVASVTVDALNALDSTDAAGSSGDGGAVEISSPDDISSFSPSSDVTAAATHVDPTPATFLCDAVSGTPTTTTPTASTAVVPHTFLSHTCCMESKGRGVGGKVGRKPSMGTQQNSRSSENSLPSEVTFARTTSGTSGRPPASPGLGRRCTVDGIDDDLVTRRAGERRRLGDHPCRPGISTASLGTRSVFADTASSALPMSNDQEVRRWHH